MPRSPVHAYTMEEKRMILQYIIQHHAYYQVKGNLLWKKMEPSFRNRHTWQSLKEHYKKQLLPNLSLAHFQLTEEQIANFRRGYGEILNVKRKEPSKSSSPVKFYNLWPDEEDDEEKENTLVAEPNTSSSVCTSQKEDTPIPKTENSTQASAAGSTSTSGLT